MATVQLVIPSLASVSLKEDAVQSVGPDIGTDQVRLIFQDTLSRHDASMAVRRLAHQLDMDVVPPWGTNLV